MLGQHFTTFAHVCEYTARCPATIRLWSSDSRSIQPTVCTERPQCLLQAKPRRAVLRRNCSHRHLLGEGRTHPEIFELIAAQDVDESQWGAGARKSALRRTCAVSHTGCRHCDMDGASAFAPFAPFFRPNTLGSTSCTLELAYRRSRCILHLTHL